jgi:hypothetical protein
MSKLEIEISGELEELLKRDAQREGISVEDLAVRRLMQTSVPRNLAEAIAPYIVHPQPGDTTTHTSRDSGRQFTDHLVKKKEQGHL